MIKRFFIAGILVWLPIIATIWIINLLVSIFDKFIALLPTQYQPDTLLHMHIPGLGLIIAIIIVLVTGILVTNFLGNKLMQWTDAFLSHIPLIGKLYAMIKQVMETILSSDGKSFRKVLLIEYPKNDVWSIAFLTSTASEKINKVTGEKMLTAFIPTTPNPTSGFLVMVPESKSTELNMSVEEAFKVVVSLGTLNTENAHKLKHKHE